MLRPPTASGTDIAVPDTTAAAVVSGLMAASDVRIARLMRVATWRALAGAEVVGEANAMLRPDRRWFISVDTWIADSFLPLVSAVADDLRQDLYTTVDEGDEAELRNWSDAGFTVLRREHHYLVPTAPDRTRLAGVALPAGMSLVSADAVDEYGLRMLDEALRQDVPGTDGWINDPQEFREYTFDERRFDPATYLVAVDHVSQAFAGLARVWNHPRQPHLGLVGVTSGYRRRGPGEDAARGRVRPAPALGSRTLTCRGWPGLPAGLGGVGVDVQVAASASISTRHSGCTRRLTWTRELAGGRSAEMYSSRTWRKTSRSATSVR